MCLNRRETLTIANVERLINAMDMKVDECGTLLSPSLEEVVLPSC